MSAAAIRRRLRWRWNSRDMTCLGWWQGWLSLRMCGFPLGRPIFVIFGMPLPVGFNNHIFQVFGCRAQDLIEVPANTVSNNI